MSIKATDEALSLAQQRAIEVRNKASFGNFNSGYEFGGWKSLFEGYSDRSQSDCNHPSVKSPKLNTDRATRSKTKTLAANTFCPSSQPKEEAIVFGIVEGTVESPRVAYLKRSQPIEEIAKPLKVKPTEMLRIASPCEEKGCLHFDGADCRLAAKIAQQLPTVTETLPPCQIRSSCRWWQQEGKSACLRCPQVVTENYYTSPLLERVADPDIHTKS